MRLDEVPQPSLIQEGDHVVRPTLPGAQSSAQADSGSSEDEAASEARSTTSDCPSLASAAAEDGLGESAGGSAGIGRAFGARADQVALQGAMPWTSRASRRIWRRS